MGAIPNDNQIYCLENPLGGALYDLDAGSWACAGHYVPKFMGPDRDCDP